MRHFKIVAEKLGGHYHVTVRAGTEQQARNKSLPKLGNLIMDEQDWVAFESVWLTGGSDHVRIILDVGEEPC